MSKLQGICILPRIVDKTKKSRFQQLYDDQRAFNLDQRNAGKRHRAFLQSIQRDIARSQFAEVFEELFLNAFWQDSLQVADVPRRVVEVLHELQALLQTRKDRELAVEWIVAKEQIENGEIVRLARLPVCVSHRNLIQICE